MDVYNLEIEVNVGKMSAIQTSEPMTLVRPEQNYEAYISRKSLQSS